MKELKSRNKEWGFYGTIKSGGKLSPAREWTDAVAWLRKAMPMWDDETILDFLDSGDGRHLADGACNAGGIANVDPAPWLTALYKFGADRPGFLNQAEVAQVNEARKQVRIAIGRLKQASAAYRGVCGAEKASDSPSRKLVFAELRKEIESLQAMMP